MTEENYPKIMNQKGAIMIEKKYYSKLGAFLFLTWLFLLPAIHTQAAVKKLDILNGSGKKSCQVDLDGDGVKEKLKLATKYDKYNYIKSSVLYVDGKKSLVLNTPSWVFSIGIDYVKMSDSNIFILCHTTGDNDASGPGYFYRYNKGRKKMEKETRLLDINENCSGASVKKVTGLEVKIQYYLQLEAIGGISWTGTYVIRDGRLKLKPIAYKAKNTTTTKYGDPDGYGRLLEKNKYKAIRDLLLYTNTSMKTVSYRADANDILTLKKIKYTKDEWFVQFEKDGKKGWFGLNGLGGMEIFYGVRDRLAG